MAYEHWSFVRSFIFKSRIHLGQILFLRLPATFLSSLFIGGVFLLASCTDEIQDNSSVLGTLTISSKYFAVNPEIWVYLSDSQGNPLMVQKAEPDTPMPLKVSSKFSDETFTLSYIVRTTFTNDNDTHIYREGFSYKDLKPGSYSIDYNNPPPISGNFSLNVSNLPEIKETRVSTPGYLTLLPSNDTGELSIQHPLSLHGSGFFSLTDVHGRTKWGFVNEVTNGQVFDFNYIDLMPMEAINMSVLGSHYTLVSQYGLLPGNNLLREGFLIDSYHQVENAPDITQIRLSHPEGVFAKFSTYVEVGNNGGRC